ncbi:hypothetical protein [Neisseria shayeganii]|uniref:Uncharacterized protein n=1 Tax=Neisseria shayeganii TaxID=607712 RepID=A0A7D7S7N7_9NEIS|nr:hypothetical protein [Neisseria shayeganii]QMT40428.1 hypothetical protein H3L94_11490 [Neisseria shayeganii]
MWSENVAAVLRMPQLPGRKDGTRAIARQYRRYERPETGPGFSGSLFFPLTLVIMDDKYFDGLKRWRPLAAHSQAITVRRKPSS